MNYVKHFLTSFLTAGILLGSSFATAATTTTESIKLVLIADPHVDVKLPLNSTHINPQSSGHTDLDKASYNYLIGAIDNFVGQNKYKAIILLGDIPAHNAFDREGKTRTRSWEGDMYVGFQDFYTKLKPDPLFYVFGNNDSPEKDYGSFVYEGESAFDDFEAYDGMDGFLSTGNQCSDKYTGSICMKYENPNQGYYTAYLGNHIRLVSLNSVLFSSKGQGGSEAAAELKWLEGEVNTAKANHESIILAMHIPPQQWVSTYLSRLKSILKANPDIVIGMLAAHTHFDEIHAFKVANYIIPVIYVPGLVTDHGNASAFKTIQVDRTATTTGTGSSTTTTYSPWYIKDYMTHTFRGEAAGKANLFDYYGFVKTFCPQHTNDTVALCLKYQIDPKTNQFYNTASQPKDPVQHINSSAVMGGHYTAGNPNNHQTPTDIGSWVVNIP